MLIPVAAMLVIGSLSIGAVVLSPREVLEALVSFGSNTPAERIVFELRLPRVMTAIVAGAALATAGLLLQTLFRNPLASPWTLGITAGGQFGAALVVVAGGAVGPAFLEGLSVLGNVSLVAGASAGCVAVALAMTGVAKRVGTVTLLVLGVMLGFLSQGLISVLMHFTNRTRGRIFASWNDGSYAGVSWPDLPYLAVPAIVGLVAAVLLVKPLNALLLGETYAASLGLHVPTVRRVVLGVAVLLAGPVTAFCGPVLFLGLIIPHLCRTALGTSDHRILVPIAAPAGAVLALAADLLVHLPWEQHFLHLNAILALVGAPFVIWMLLAKRDMQRLL